MPRRAETGWMERMAKALIGATAIAAACIALTGTGFGQRDNTPGARLRTAMQTYQARMWPQAFAQFAALADAGDPAAARVAAMMARQGPRLFGQRFEVEPQRLARWDQAMRGFSLRHGGLPAAEAAETLPAPPVSAVPAVTVTALARDAKADLHPAKQMGVQPARD